VDWYQAADFCLWVGGRLPTDAEYEYMAANGANNDDYPWGSDAPTCDLTVYGPCSDYPLEVCSLSPAGDNDDGICDLTGNVGEWVEDDWHDWIAGGSGYDIDDDSVVDAPLDGSAWVEDPRLAERVARGGGFSTYGVFLLVAGSRVGIEPTTVNREIGFRCAR
jgi:formylglycine-generating enzyme required for sulfatase activity